jgi:hypothetical protein
MSTIVTRSGKGSPLTHNEVDANFNNLNTDKVEKTSAAITGGTITGTRINPRISSTTSTATLTVNSDSFDQAVLTAQAVALSVAAPTGTPVNGQKLTLRFKDNATAQTISWTTTSGGFRVIGCTLPTTTVISKTVYIGCIYNSDDTFWDIVSVGQQI